MAILPVNRYSNNGTSQNAGYIPASTAPQQQTAVLDPRHAMWRQQMRQKQIESGRYLSPEARMGMLGPGIASLPAGAVQGPTRQAAQPMPLPSPQGLAAPQGGISMGDLVQTRPLMGPVPVSGVPGGLSVNDLFQVRRGTPTSGGGRGGKSP